MIRDLVGGQASEAVLMYLANYGDGYSQIVADTFSIRLSAVQRAFKKFETAGVIVSRLKGRTRVFEWNPRYPLKNELLQLLEKALQLLPEEDTKEYFRQRTRPRRTGKRLS
jgi:DNA-binding transcriptional ArsR family regulator